jgi:hypothetical protein
MSKRRLLYLAMVGVLLGVGGQGWSAPRLVNEAVDVVGVGAEAEPLIAIEASRTGIVNRIMADFADGLSARNLDANALRHALTMLRADQLLAAALVNSLDEVLAIATQPVATGLALQRYVAISPLTASDSANLPTAAAYLTRSGEALRVEKGDGFAFRDATTQVVGYFVPTSAMFVSDLSKQGMMLKDGAGSGPNSWIGFTTGNNSASGSGSAVAAGTWNSATNTSSMVVGGSNNTADGISSMVIGGFDNHATAIDSLVGAGAGNRATGARSVVVGGGYNLASGQWSFVGGGGRETGTGVAGAAAQDHIASGKWSTIAGGYGNRASDIGATVAGGGGNTASGYVSSVGGGGGGFPNTASGAYGTVGGGASNTASGNSSTVPGGYSNIASGTESFAAGYNSTASHSGTFVWSDSVGGGVSTRANEFVVKAAGGVTINSDRGISLNAVNTPIITRAWDPFDGTAAVAKQGIGRWGLFMEPSKLTIGIPGDDIPGRIFQVAKYALNGTATPMLTVNQDGLLEIGGAGNYGSKIAIDSFFGRYIGNQNSTLYSRTNDAFAWYLNGVHANNQFDPGTGGSVLATLQTGASTTAVTGTFRAQVFTATSDRNAKSDFTTLSPKAILAKVAQLPIMSWSYKNEQGAGVRHIGPVSQDFKRLFNIGYDDKSIATVDADGVALAAIKGLKQLVDEKDAKISKLERELGLIKAKLGMK